jgi:hypothetical protein
MRISPVFRFSLLTGFFLGLVFSQEHKAPIVQNIGGRFTIVLEDIPFEQVLDAIRPVAGVAITASRQANEQPVSADVRDASTEEALRTILRGHDVFYLYRSEGQKAALKAVWVYGRGEAKGMQPAAADALQQPKALEALLRDSDPAVRMRAFNGLLEKAGSDSRSAVIAAVMEERDDGVRGGMVEALHNSGSDLPPELVSTLLNDPLEQIRILTLESVRGSSNARELFTAALTDSSPHVRSRAQELLDEIDPASGPPR